MPEIQDIISQLVTGALEGAGQQGSNGNGKQPQPSNGSGGSHLGRGLIAGVGAAALAPVAVKGLSKLAREGGVESVKHLATSPGTAGKLITSGPSAAIGDAVKGKVSEAGDNLMEKVSEGGGAGGILSNAIKEALPFGGGGGGGDKGGGLGVGHGRRIPVQQSIDIAAPVDVVYNQWTQFDEWPKFMHRVVRASQEDETTVTLAAKIWTRTREFKAKIQTQRPDERVAWRVEEGMTHAGLVTFHEIGPNLTRVMLSLDVDPSGMIEKIARGARHIKRAARSDLHRFKAYIELAEHETGAWRGRIEDGEVVEDHDPEYDKGRAYSDADEVLAGEAPDTDEDDEEEEQDDTPRSRGRAASQRSNSRSTGGSRSSGTRSSGTRSSGSRSSGSGSRSSASKSSGAKSSGTKASGSGSKATGSRAKATTSRSNGSSKTSRSNGSSKSSSSKTGSASSAAKSSGGTRRTSASSSSSGRRRTRGAKD